MSLFLYQKNSYSYSVFQNWMNKITVYAKLLCNPEFGGLAMHAVIGAMAVNIYLDFYNLLIIFIIGSIASVFGFILNDYVDIELDKVVKEPQCKPLVNGYIYSVILIFFQIKCYIAFASFTGEKILEPRM